MPLDRSVARASAIVLLVLATGARAQAPATPYQRSLEQQRLDDLQQQNARQQQQIDEAQRDRDWNQSLQQSQARAATQQAQGQQVLQAWKRRPPLDPARNPLLGRWRSLGTGAAAGGGGQQDIAALAAALVGGITTGLCDDMLGRGGVQFTPDAVLAIGPDGHPRLRYHAEYRGEGARVVVLPREPMRFTHMIVDLHGADRATVAAVGCRLERSGGGAVAAASPPVPVKWDYLATSPSNGGMDAYVDAATIRRAGRFAHMVDLWDFKGPHSFEGKRFLSVRNEYEYDCTGVRRRMLSTRGFSEHMGRGGVVGSSESTMAWEPIPAGSLFMEHWKKACARS